MTQTNSNADRALALLNEQHELLEAVGRLCTAQSRLIDEDEAEDLLAVIEQRGLILEKAAALGNEIDRVAASIPPDDAAQPLIRRRRTAITELARAIAAADAADTKRLGSKRDELARALASMNTNRVATGAYAAPSKLSGPGFQDTNA
ncbi:MAG: hypothetical protein K2Y21_13895 [Phycisphaerales bacterium]|nr:hypothetical protein [Phycisphaerales bacterium]